ARVAGGIAHFAQHGFVEVREGVDLLARVEVNAVDLVDDVAQQVAADHAVLHALEHVGDDLALAALLPAAGQPAQVGKEAGAARAVGAVAFVLVDEGQQFVAGEAVLACGPVAPTVGGFDDGVVGLAVELRLLLMHDLEVVEELEEHHPSEQRQAVDVAVEALVLAQDLAGAADQRREVVARGQWCLDAWGSGLLFGCGHSGTSRYWYRAVCRRETASLKGLMPP